MNINKTAIRDKMLSLQEAQLRYAEKQYADYLQNAMIDRIDVTDDQDRSQAQQNSVFARSFECPLHNHEEAIGKVRAINFDEKTVVEPGSIIKFNDKNFVVSVASSQFEYQGQMYIGISTEAPIYKAMKGSSAGDTFEYGGQEYRVQAVY